MPEDLTELRERARRVERHGLTERVRIDQHTYEQLVEFVEAERCSLKEALRRAVRLGVQVLLAERRQPIDVPDVPYETVVGPPSVSFGAPIPDDFNPMRADVAYSNVPTLPKGLETVPTFSEMKQSDGSSDYARTRPPGLA